MKIEDLTKVAKEALAQTFGQKYMDSVSNGEIVETDLASITSWAKSATAGDYSNMPTEKWFNAILDKVYRIECETRKLPLEIPSIYKQGHKYGAFLERVKFDTFNIMTDPISDLTSLSGADIAAIEYETYKNNAKAEIFGNKQAFMIPHTRPAELLYAAVTSASEFSMLIAGIENAVDMTLTATINTLTRDLIAVAHAKNITNGNVKHLLTIAKNKGLLDASATKHDYLKSDACIRDMIMTIENTRNEFTNLDSEYTGINAFKTFSPKNYQHGIVLNVIKNQIMYNTQSTTFNNSKINLDWFEGINCWQGIKNKNEETMGEAFDWDAISKIDVKANTTAGIASPVNKADIVAILFDEKAIGLTDRLEKTTTKYRASVDDINAFTHYRIESLIDDDYKMCTFILD